jgi:hypothetical protein
MRNLGVWYKHKADPGHRRWAVPPGLDKEAALELFNSLFGRSFGRFKFDEEGSNPADCYLVEEGNGEKFFPLAKISP